MHILKIMVNKQYSANFWLFIATSTLAIALLGLKVGNALRTNGFKIVKFAANQTPAESSPENLCAICFSEENTYAFIPCGHLCACKQCSNVIMEDDPNCPICRRHANGTIRIYQS
ncbi:hypothetical protein GPALN_006457 [Globodera pallida]|nr:hypothetical protein GPALN_006457 [Globodera pallida]